MIDIFWIKLVLSFIVGSLWITIATIIAERFGTKTGGLIAGLPSTVVVALFFIGFAETPEIASQATTVIPLIVGVLGLFMVTFAILSRKSFATGLISALLVWSILSTIVILFKLENFTFSLVVYLLLLIFSYYILEKKLKIRSMGKVKVHYTTLQIAFRAFLSGSIITFAVFMSKFGGPIFGGVFAGFPAVFTSTLIVTYKSRGIEFSRSITKTLMISAMVNVVVYTIAVRYLYITVGLILGTIIAYIISILGAYFIYIFINKRMS